MMPLSVNKMADINAMYRSTQNAFVDPDFRPCERSVSGKDVLLDKYAGVHWLRVNKVPLTHPPFYPILPSMF